MNIYSNDRDFWENAINTRRSVRAYERRPVGDVVMKRLAAFTDNLETPFPQSVEIRYFKTEENCRLANSLSKPPEDAIAFLAETDPVSAASVGFVGELVILYATGLGLSTCWYGHYCLPELERLMPHLGEHAKEPMPKFGIGKGNLTGRRAICISPLGYLQTDGMRLLDRITSNMMSYKRKPLNERLENGMKSENLPPPLLFALEMAIKAPSAANTQHWVFNVSPDFKTLTLAKPKGYQHIKWEYPDVCAGACAAHFWIGMRMQDIPCAVELTPDGDRAVWSFKL